MNSRALQFAKLMDNLFRRADQAGRANRLGRDELAFARLQEGAMAVMNLAEARIPGQAEILDPRQVLIPYVGEIGRDHLVLASRLLPDFVGEMQNGRDPRAGLLDHALVGQLFAGPEHAGADQRRGAVKYFVMRRLTEKNPSYDLFVHVDFPPPAGIQLPASVVYVFEFMRNGRWSPFYVGETGGFRDRMHDYERAHFAAQTDFQVGEAVRFFASHGYWVRVGYEEVQEIERPARERAVIRQKLWAGARLLNCFPGYNYRVADEQEERTAVRRFCWTLIP